MQIQVRDMTWTVKVIPSAKFKRLYGECVAITVFEKRILAFDESEFSLKPIIHELVHAYLSTLYIDSAELNRDQYEEIIAQFLEDYLLVIYKQAKAILTNQRKS